MRRHTPIPRNNADAEPRLRGEASGSPHHKGLTLIEVLLALALTSGLVLAMTVLYRQVGQVRQRLTSEIRSIHDQRLIMQRVTDELRSAMTNRFLQIGLEGSLERMEFVTATLPGPIAWVQRDATDDPVPPEYDQQIVTYQLRYVETEEGDIVIAGLERITQKRLTTAIVDPDEDLDATLMSSSIRFLSLRYFDGAGWAESWTGGDLPMAVEVILGTTPLPEGMELTAYLEQYETARRVVYIPGGRQALGTTIVRGLGGGR